MMYTINDPMFALILRFVGRGQKITFQNDKFIKKELKAIRAHIEKFPPEERELRALEWIEAHASEYRKSWEKETIGGELSRQRCPDCPLAVMDDSEHCEIHDEWLNLLQRYAADEISSREYVENTLRLIAQHKENLKIKLSAMRNARKADPQCFAKPKGPCYTKPPL